MSLRDWFAGTVTAGILARDGRVWVADTLAHRAFEIADALIAKGVES